MRRSGWLVVLLLSAAVATAPAKTKKKAELPQLFCQARWVYVETYEGDPDGPWMAQQYPLDYNAAEGVRNRVQQWGRYRLTYQAEQADLVMVVWKARPEGNRLPGQPTQVPPMSGPGQAPGTGPGTGPNIGSTGPNMGPGTVPTIGQSPGNPQGRTGTVPGGGPDGGGVWNGGQGAGVWPTKDQLAVYAGQSDAELQTPLWKKSEKEGLDEPDMTLFGKLADAVDDACAQKQ